MAVTLIASNWMLQILKKIPLVSRANAVCKSKLQERRAFRNLDASRKLAKERGIEPLEGEALRRAVQTRLSSRARNRAWPRLKGNLHIFLAYSVSNWESILPRSLVSFGRVTEFEWGRHGFYEGSQAWVHERGRMNDLMLEAFQQADRDQPVDVVVGYLSGNTIAPEMLLKMAEGGAAVVNFCFDDKLSWPGKVVGNRFTSPAAIAHAVDLNLTNAPESIVKYATCGGLALFWPEAGFPEVHRPYDIPFDIDLSFVGARYGWRADFIDRLKSHGIHVECFGKGWQNGPVSEEEMVKLYSRSRINLGFGGIGYSRNLRCLKGRDFEVTMSGGLYLVHHNPELASLFDEDREIVTFIDEEDCARKVHRLLAEPVRAATIRKNARLRALRDHTYEARWNRLFMTLGLIQENCQ